MARATKPTVRLCLALMVTGAPLGCATDRVPKDQAQELEYEGPVYLRDCSAVIDSIVESWKSEIQKEICALTEDKLEAITIGPIGPLDSSAAAKSAYRDFRQSCTDLKGQRRLLKPEEVNQYIKDSVLGTFCGEDTF